MRCLVTGGAGFIGSHLTDKLIALGHKVTVLDNLSLGKMENVNKKATFLKKDISEQEYFGSADYIFHLAAIPRVPYSLAYPTDTHNSNITGTYKILHSAKLIKCKKFIFASSSSVYGDNKLPLKEDMQPEPISPYAFHKWVGEEYCKLFYRVWELPTVSLRFFNVYGPRADPESEYSLVIAKFLKQNSEGKPLTIYGDGEQSRDFNYVDDVVSACIKAIDAPVGKGEVINICSQKNITINKIAQLIGGEKTYLPPREGDVLHTLGDNSEAKRLLGWQPKIDIEDGLKKIKI
jgi:UDP-glucose 4-epimerase